MDSQRDSTDSSATAAIRFYEATGLLPLAPRLLNRHQAAAYIGRSVRVLDKLSPDVRPQIGYIRLSSRGDKMYPKDLLDAFIDRCIQAQVPAHLLPAASMAA